MSRKKTAKIEEAKVPETNKATQHADRTVKHIPTVVDEGAKRDRPELRRPKEKK